MPKIKQKIVNSTTVLKVNPITGRITNPGMYLVELEEFRFPVLVKSAKLKEALKTGELECKAEFIEPAVRERLRTHTGSKMKMLPKKTVV